MKRRQALIGAGGAALAVLAACSKTEPQAPAAAAPAPAAPQSPPAAAPAPAAPQAESSRQAFETASRGTGFVVGQPMAARQVLVFFDPQCPHCATLWVNSKPLHDRIRMVWMPVAFIGPSSAPQGALLLASADPAKAMDLHETLLAGGKGGIAVPGASDADLLAKIKANTELWKSLDAGSVPHMVYRISADGPYGVQSGGLPTAQLTQLLGL